MLRERRVNSLALEMIQRTQRSYWSLLINRHNDNFLPKFSHISFHQLLLLVANPLFSLLLDAHFVPITNSSLLSYTHLAFQLCDWVALISSNFQVIHHPYSNFIVYFQCLNPCLRGIVNSNVS